MKVAGYVRVGPDEQVTDPDGAKQKLKLRDFSNAKEWALEHVYQDIGYSGEDLNRPGLVRLLSEMRFDVVLVDRATRLVRKKKNDLAFLLSLFDTRNITAIDVSWSWDYLSQYMRYHYRSKCNPLYKSLDAETEG